MRGDHVIQRTPAGVVVRLPVRTQSEANVREHWARRHRRAAAQRRAVGLVVAVVARELVPAVVRLVRIAPRMLDDDNLRGALKAVRDAVAKCYGVADGPRGPIRWEYDQRKGRVREYAVEIALCRAVEGPRSAEEPPGGTVVGGE